MCNRNTLKVSYSCMPNMQSIIQADNRKKLDKKTETSERCNCRRKDNCPVNGQCQKTNVIYQAVVKCDGTSESYVGLTSNSFKTRYNKHKNTFNDIRQKFSTELSKHIWTLKCQNRDYEIKWNILCRAQPYSNATKRCNLCITEKYYIICRPELATLNKRSELISKCRHQAKFLLGSIT